MAKSQNKKGKLEKEERGDAKPKREYLLLEFSVLSFIAFSIIGYTVINAVRPALESFILRKEESTTVVLVNRFANQLLTKSDFELPISDAQQKRIEQFVNNANITGAVRFFALNASGTVIYAQPKDYIGTSLAQNADLKFVSEHRQTVARFQQLVPEEQQILGISEALIQVVPITFGTSEQVSGYLYVVSRLGLLGKQIEESELAMTVRIVGGMFFLYILLFVIVWRASRTIRNQAGELASYAKTLEQKVRERTKKLEETNKQQIAQAKELARLKDEFVFIAAHELKAPITNLRWIIDEFFSNEKMKAQASQEIHNIMEVIKKASNALVKLVSDLLSVARIESGGVKVTVHPTDLISIIQEMVLQFKKEAEGNNIMLTFEYEKGKRFPFAMSDSERLKEVFSNLISNAIKYNKPQGSIDITIMEHGEFLEARINHSDYGIDEEEMKHLFYKFWRSPKHRNVEGTGLGLWITKQLVERMGGSIWAESRKDVDTTFFVRLPIADEKKIKNVPEKSV